MTILSEIEKQKKIKLRQDKVNKLYALCQVHEEVLQLITDGASIEEVNKYFINESKELREEINVILIEKI
jgi:hypothetical protein